MSLLFENKVILYAAINILSLYTLYSALNIICKPKKLTYKFTKYILYIIYFLIGMATFGRDGIFYINIIIQLVSVFLISLIFETSIKSKIALAFFVTSFKMIIELFVGIILKLIFGIAFSELLLNKLFNVIGSIICQLFMLMVIRILQSFVLSKDNSENVFLELSLQMCIIPICSIIILVSYTQVSFQDSLNEYITILSLFLIVIMNVFCFYLFDKLKLTEKLKSENQILKNQSEYFYLLEQNINDTFEKVRTLKHDMKHQLLYLKSKTEDNSEQSLGDLKACLENLIQETTSSEFVYYTQNKMLNRLLNYKLNLIGQSNIKIDIKVNVPENAQIDESSLYVILGNGIDNAITNFDDSKSQNKMLNLRIMDDNGNLYIRISNPFTKKLRLKNGLPVTCKSDKLSHGLGLSSIKKIVENKNGIFKISTDNYDFVLEILLYGEMIYNNNPNICE